MGRLMVLYRKKPHVDIYTNEQCNKERMPYEMKKISSQKLFLAWIIWKKKSVLLNTVPWVRSGYLPVFVPTESSWKRISSLQLLILNICPFHHCVSRWLTLTIQLKQRALTAVWSIMTEIAFFLCGFQFSVLFQQLLLKTILLLIHCCLCRWIFRN